MKKNLIFSHFSFFLVLTVVSVLMHVSPAIASEEQKECRPPLSNEYCAEQYKTKEQSSWWANALNIVPSPIVEKAKTEYNVAKTIITNFWHRVTRDSQKNKLEEKRLAPEDLKKERQAFVKNEDTTKRRKAEATSKLRIQEIRKLIDSQPEVSTISDPNVQEANFSLPEFTVTQFNFTDLKPLSTPKPGFETEKPKLHPLTASSYKIPENLIVGDGINLNAVQNWRVPSAKELITDLKPHSNYDSQHVDHLIGQILKKRKSCHLAIGFFMEGTGEMSSCLFDLGFHQQSLEQLELYFKKQKQTLPQTKIFLNASAEEALSKWVKNPPRSLRERLGETLSAHHIEYPNKSLRSRSGYMQALFHLGKNEEKKAVTAAKMVDPSSEFSSQAKIIQLVLSARPTQAFKELQKVNLNGLDETERGLVHAILASFEFEKSNFKETSALLRAINEKDPAWIQSLIKLGWSQLLSEDHFGAIGNMHSLHTPMFGEIYLPESYVVRTIGYLNICQYGDAYRTLTQLEKTYRPVLTQVTDLLNAKKTAEEYTKVFEDFLSSGLYRKTASSTILPKRVLLEISRQKDIVVLQKQILQIEKELQQYTFIENLISSELAQLLPQKTSKSTGKNVKTPKISQKTLEKHRLLSETFKKTKTRNLATTSDLKKTSRLLRSETGKTAKSHLIKIKDHLTTLLDNNEILRFEVFSNSGENLRQISSNSLQTKRVHRNIKPRKKELQWSVSDEIWLDEIGHYRSSLKNGCAQETKTAKREN